MAPQLTEDEIDDLIYFARAGEDADLAETVSQLAEREKVTPAEILLAARDEGNKSTTLHMASGNGHSETVRGLIRFFDARPKDEKQAFLDDANAHGNTGLHWASLGGHLPVVRLLMQHGASPAIANEQNYVPLDLAQFNGHDGVAQFYLAAAGMLEERNQEEAGALDGALDEVKLGEGAEGAEKEPQADAKE